MRMGYREFLKRLGLSRAGFHLALKTGRLPQPSRIGPGFLIDWSEEYLQACLIARGRMPAHLEEAVTEKAGAAT